ncbi:homoserine dehydrogenase, partial [Staphylococcus aureus]|nr:homoserine dehydrogenase [Staphylococcus aureus]MBO8517848.1 homoserine dehydrogenase [Staphylococcus aureus]
PFHRSLRVANYDNQSYAAVIVGLESSPEELITKHGYEVDKVYLVF